MARPTKPATPARRRLQRGAPGLMRLEQRLMFDGAAVDAAIDTAAQAAAAAAAARDAAATATHALAADVVPPAAGQPAAREVAFIDSRIPDAQALAASIRPGVEVVLVGAGENGIERMVSALEGARGLAAIHIIGHGAEGRAALGSASLSLATLDAFSAALARVGAVLDAEGDLLLYGCNVGAGEAGAALLSRITGLTGADVAASTNLTGAAGDWVLERASGRIEAAPALLGAAAAGYAADLVLPAAVAIGGVSMDSGISGTDLVTTDNTLLVTGRFDSATCDGLAVDVAGTTYVLGIDARLSVQGDAWQLDLRDLPMAAGTYHLSATATAAGATMGTDARDIVIDTAAPLAGSGAPTDLDIVSLFDDTGASNADFVTSNPLQVISGTFDPADTASLVVDLAGVRYDLADNALLTATGSAWDLDVTGVALPDGAYNFTVTARDLAGNATSVSRTLVIDTAPPLTVHGTSTDLAVTGIALDSGASVNDLRTADAALLVHGTFDPAQTDSLVVTFNGTAYALGTDFELAASANVWELDLSGVQPAPGAYLVEVTATDLAGNAAVATDIVTIDPTELFIGATRVSISAISTDTGALADDFVTADGSLLVVGEFQSVATASLVAELDNGVATLTLGQTEFSHVGDDWKLDLRGIGLDEGSHVLTVTAFDAGGTALSSATQTIVIDNTAPGALPGATEVAVLALQTDSGSSAADFVTSSRNLVLSGTYDNLDTDALAVDFDGVTYRPGGAELSVSGATWTLDLSATTLAAGRYELVVRATDLAGNVSLAQTGVVVDTVAPLTGTAGGGLRVTGVTLDSGGSSSDFVTDDHTLLISGRYLGDDTDVLSVTFNGRTYTLGDAELTATSDTWELDATGTTLADGVYQVSATATDLAGNAATVTQALSVVSLAPATVTVSIMSVFADTAGASTSDFLTKDPTLLVSGSFAAADTATFTVTLDGITFTLGADRQLTAAGDTWQLDITATTLLDGDHVVQATATDHAGGVTSASQTITVDTVAPSIGTGSANDLAILSVGLDTAGASATDFITSDASPVLNGSFNAADTTLLEVEVDGQVFTTGPGSPLTTSGDTWTLDLTGTLLADGEHPVNARASDAAGNVATVAQTLTVDTAAAVAGALDITTATDTGIDDLVTAYGRPQLTFTSEAGLDISLRGADGVTLLTRGAHYGVTFDAATSTYTVTLLDASGSGAGTAFGTHAGASATGNNAATADGTYVLSATDAAGNATAVGSFIIDTAVPGALALTSATDTGATDLLTASGAPALVFSGDPGFTVDVIGADGATALAAGTQFTVNYDALTATYTVSLVDALGDGSLSLFGTQSAGIPTGNAAAVADGVYTVLATGAVGVHTVGTFTIDTVAPAAGTGAATDLAVLAMSADSGASSADFVTRDQSIIVSGSFNAADTALLEVSVDNATYRANVPGVPGQVPHLTTTGDTWTLDLSDRTLANGSYTLSAVAFDAAGNPAEVVQGITIDTTLPVAPLAVLSITDDTGPDATDFVTSDTALVISGSYDSVSATGLQVDFLGFSYVLGTNVELTTSGDAWQLDARGLSAIDGNHVLTVTAQAANGTFSSSSATIVVDTTGPSQVSGAALAVTGISTNTGVSSTDFSTADSTLRISGTFDSNPVATSTLVVSVDGTDYTLGVDAVLTSLGDTWTLDLTALPLADGVHPVSVLASDLAGNATLAMQNVTIDPQDVTPASGVNIGAISIDSGLFTGDFVTSDRTLLFSGVFDAANNQVLTLTLDNPALGALSFDLGVTGSPLTAVGNDWQLDLSGISLADGAYVVTASTIDFTGAVTTAVATVTVDTTAPASGTGAADDLAVLAVASDTAGLSLTDFITGDATLQIGGSYNAADTAVLEVSIDGQTFAVTPGGPLSTSNNTWTLDLTGTPLTDGDHTVIARATDLAGNATTVTQIVTVDTAAPAAAVLSLVNFTDTGASATDGVTQSGTFDLSVASVEAGATLGYEVSADGGATWAVTGAAQSALADGSYQFHAVLADAAGNTSTSNVMSVVVDTAAPAAAVLSLANFTDTGASATDGVTQSGTFDLSVASVEAGTTLGYEVSVDGGATWAVTGAAQSALADGSYQFRAVLADAAGNTSASNVMSVVVDTAAPAAAVADSADTPVTQPVITGSVALAAGESLAVVVDGVTYAQGGADLHVSAGRWTLALPASHVLVGGNTYTVSTVVTDAAGNSTTDAAAAQVRAVVPAPVAAPVPPVPVQVMARDTGTADESVRETGPRGGPQTGLPAGARVGIDDFVRAVRSSLPVDGLREPLRDRLQQWEESRDRDGRSERELPTQSFAAGSGEVSLTLPIDALAPSSASARLALTAALADGKALPEWLKFDPARGQFTGTPPAGFTGEIEIRVQAVDESAQRAEVVVRIRISDQSPSASMRGRAGLTAQLDAAGRGWKADRDRLMRLAQRQAVRATTAAGA